MVKVTCATCYVAFWMTEEMHERRVNDGVSFCCPSGHQNIYRPSQNEIQRQKIKELEGELVTAINSKEFWEELWSETMDDLICTRKEKTTALLRAAGYKSQWLKEKHRREDMEALQ